MSYVMMDVCDESLGKSKKKESPSWRMQRVARIDNKISWVARAKPDRACPWDRII
jgi:hypothetical protein